MVGNTLSAAPGRGGVLACLLLAAAAQADYRDDIGLIALQTEFAGALATGAGVPVTQVEAPVLVDPDGDGPMQPVEAWRPDPSNAQFDGKLISNRSPPAVPDLVSPHATGVGRYFYGNDSGVAAGIDAIEVFEAEHWLTTALPAGTVSTRVANHSWVGTGPGSVDFLPLVDALVERQEQVNVVGTTNAPTAAPLLSSAFNVISVGRTDGLHGAGSVELGDALYTAGRVKPDIVAPVGSTSAATALVASSAALLIDAAHPDSDPLLAFTDAERSEVIKAVLMAGAARRTQNTTPADITDYGAAPFLSDNGLDRRYGAGQLDILTSYRILLPGEQDSLEDGGRGTILEAGFDYDDAFGGGDAANAAASYSFSTGAAGALLTAALVWNLGLDDANRPLELYDLDLRLFEAGARSLVASSDSRTENSEHLWLSLDPDTDYLLQVVVGSGAAFVWDYGLAWTLNAAPVPLPAALPLLLSALLLLAVRWRRG